MNNCIPEFYRFSINKVFALLILLIGIVSCGSEGADSESLVGNDTSLKTDSVKESVDTNTAEIHDYTAESIYTDGLGWGYQILDNGNAYISQPHIPAIQGMKGFSTEKDALKTADLAIYKIKNGLFPPSISKEEMDSLGVLD